MFLFNEYDMTSEILCLMEKQNKKLQGNNKSLMNEQLKLKRIGMVNRILITEEMHTRYH